MDKAATDTGAQQLSGTLVDAHTGEILATSQRPTYTAYLMRRPLRKS